ncbi:MAG: metal-dependent transcriptional regulator [Candidatus Eremiobacteraeota bacterium]|nr:metal-dependent transcriptional regulator [Candidatus Eremiobacteraeota bacterium]MBV9699405.1 metal-dependent transcriptional regulator [Candidatus Eremiobacteraeota bacterium]
MPGHSHSHFAESFEMYLKAIYRLEREGPGVTTSALATELGVAPASVSGMLKKLVGEGFVEHEVRGDIKLTRKGLEVAVGVVRRNRLAERLLTDILDMPWDEVYAEACILEHAISERVEERLIATLGNPTTCPHGHPIPPKDLTEPVMTGIPLAQVEPGTRVTVSGVTEQMPEILRYLGGVGVRPGARLNVLEKAPLGGPLTIEVDGERHAISLELARTVMIS